MRSIIPTERKASVWLLANYSLSCHLMLNSFIFLNLISKSMALLFFSRVNAPLWGPWASDLWAKAASVPEEIVEVVSEAVGDHYVEATKVYRQRTEAWQLMLFSWKNLAKVKRKQRPLVKVELKQTLVQNINSLYWLAYIFLMSLTRISCCIKPMLGLGGDDCT